MIDFILNATESIRARLLLDRSNLFKRDSIIIIGAGFSKAFGLPLSKDLLNDSEVFFQREHLQEGKLFGYPKDNWPLIEKDFAHHFQPGGFLSKNELDFETLLARLTKIAQLQKMHVESYPGDSPEIEYDHLAMHYARICCLHLIHETSVAIRKDPSLVIKVVSFLKMIGPEATIIDLNYDSILDYCYRQAFPERKIEETIQGQPRIIKLHGTVEKWTHRVSKTKICLSKPHDYFVRKKERPGVPCTEYILPNLEDGRIQDIIADFDWTPDITLPLYHKEFPSGDGRDLVKTAFVEFSRTRSIYLLGCSFGPFENILHGFLGYGLLHTGLQGKDIQIFDPQARTVKKRLLKTLGVAAKTGHYHWQNII